MTSSASVAEPRSPRRDAVDQPAPALVRPGEGLLVTGREQPADVRVARLARTRHGASAAASTDTSTAGVPARARTAPRRRPPYLSCRPRGPASWALKTLSARPRDGDDDEVVPVAAEVGEKRPAAGDEDQPRGAVAGEQPFDRQLCLVIVCLPTTR